MSQNNQLRRNSNHGYHKTFLFHLWEIPIFHLSCFIFFINNLLKLGFLFRKWTIPGIVNNRSCELVWSNHASTKMLLILPTIFGYNWLGIVLAWLYLLLHTFEGHLIQVGISVTRVKLTHTTLMHQIFPLTTFFSSFHLWSKRFHSAEDQHNEAHKRLRRY